MIVAVVLASGCMETQRGLGEECLKDADCVSGLCSELRCAAPPPTTDARPEAEGGDAATTAATSEASSEAATDDDDAD